MYILFQLPRIGVELFCFTVLLEPTNSRVAFVILRNDPPLIFFLGVFDFLFQLGDCLIFFSFYYLEEIEHIVSFHFGVISLAYSWLNQKEKERKIHCLTSHIHDLL